MSMTDNASCDDETQQPEEITAEDYDNLAPLIDSGTWGLILVFPIALAVDILAHLFIR